MEKTILRRIIREELMKEAPKKEPSRKSQMDKRFGVLAQPEDADLSVSELKKIVNDTNKQIASILKKAAGEMTKFKGRRVKMGGKNRTITKVISPLKDGLEVDLHLDPRPKGNGASYGLDELR